MSLIQVCDTSRPRKRQATAFRADLRSHAFVDDCEMYLSPTGLVSKHIPEHRPTGVKHRFRHTCLCQFGRIHVSDVDNTIRRHNGICSFVEEVFANVGYLSMDSPHAVFVSRPLLYSEHGFKAPIGALNIDLSAVAHCGERLKTKVYTDFADARGWLILDFRREADKPLTAGIFDKLSRFNHAVDRARLPEMKRAAFVGNCAGRQFECARYHRYPAQRTLRSKRSAKLGRVLYFIAGFSECSADGAGAIRVNTKFRRASCDEIDEVEVSFPLSNAPLLPTAFAFALRGATEIPNLITRRRQPREVFPLRTILNAVAKRDYHLPFFPICVNNTPDKIGNSDS